MGLSRREVLGARAPKRAEAHGGRVSDASAQEEGTWFTIELPLDARPFQARSAVDTQCVCDAASPAGDLLTVATIL
jgi:hypothetical protein